MISAMLSSPSIHSPRASGPLWKCAPCFNAYESNRNTMSKTQIEAWHGITMYSEGPRRDYVITKTLGNVNKFCATFQASGGTTHSSLSGSDRLVFPLDWTDNTLASNIDLVYIYVAHFWDARQSQTIMITQELLALFKDLHDLTYNTSQRVGVYLQYAVIQTALVRQYVHQE